MHSEKNVLRAKYQKAVKELTAFQKESASLAICERLLKLPLLSQAPRVAFFSARLSEPNLTFLFKNLRGKEVGFPRVNPTTNTIDFIRVEKLSDLKVGAFGILEPLAGNSLTLQPSDVILVPGLSFDQEGGRLGSGKGFYDKFLQGIPQLTRVGICFEVQLHASTLPKEPHDVKMNYVVTETQLLGPGL